MLRELKIENYRCFEKLEVKDLAQVNLIVGKNNVGKTSLLEAIYLYISDNKPTSLLEILSAREQTQEQFDHISNGVLNYYQLSTLFRFAGQNSFNSFLISSDINGLLFGSLTNLGLIIQFGETVTLGPLPTPASSHINWSAKDNRSTLFLPTKEEHMIASNIFHDASILMPEEIRQLSHSFQLPHYFIDSRGLSIETLRQLWDEINLTPEEDAVELAMQVLEPNLERIGFSSRQPSIGAIKVRLQGQPNRISLSDLGDGMRRLLGLAMSLSVAKSGYLIIDEIDTGLHYEVQESMWRLVLETAKRLDVQVFATTHSWDCISAFQSALSEMDDPSIGKLIRLDARGGEIRAIEYDAEDLKITVAQGIEVR